MHGQQSIKIWNHTASKYSYWRMSERMWKDVTGNGCGLLWDIPEYSCTGVTEETHANLSLSTWFPSRNSNQTHPDYKPELLSPEPGVHKYITHLKILGSWRSNMKKGHTEYPPYKRQSPRHPGAWDMCTPNLSQHARLQVLLWPFLRQVSLTCHVEPLEQHITFPSNFLPLTSSEVLTAVQLRIQIFLALMQCSWV